MPKSVFLQVAPYTSPEGGGAGICQLRARNCLGGTPPDPLKNTKRPQWLGVWGPNYIRAYALGLRRSQALQAPSTGRLYPPSPFCRDARSGTSVEASSAHVNGQRRSRQFRV